MGTLRVLFRQMAVCTMHTRAGTMKESCSLTDENGVHWCFKTITNVHRNGFDKAFVCCGVGCNCKLFYSSPTNYLVEGVHCCLFDHEREFRKRQRLCAAVAAMEEDCTRRPCEIVRIVKEKMQLTRREEISLAQFVSRKTATGSKRFPEDINDFVIPEELKHSISGNTDVGDTLFLIYDSAQDEPHDDRFMIFASFSMRQRARLAREVFADGTYRSVSNMFATLYTLHAVFDNVTYPIFFILMSNERKRTFERAFVAIKTWMPQFNSDCVVHVDCQLAAISAFSDVFRCRIQLCLFHQNQAVWRAVSKFGLAAPYNSKTNIKLHIWIRRLLSLPFLPVETIKGSFEELFERDAVSGPFSVEEEFLEQFKQLTAYYRRFWIDQIPIDMWCQHSNRERTNNRCESFHNMLRQEVSIVHPNPLLTIQFLRRIDNESTSAFEAYLGGDDVKRTKRRAAELERKLCEVLDRYNRNKEVITQKQFLDSISMVYLEYYYHEKMARRNISLKLLSMTKGQIDSIAAVIDEQNKYDQLEDETNTTEYVERNNETEMFFDSLIDATSIHLNGELDERTFCRIDERHDGQVVSIVDESEPRTIEENTPTQKSRDEKKPKRRRVTFLKRLEKARARARRGVK